MILVPVSVAITGSLADPREASSILAAVRWVEALLYGSLATVVAVVAVATIGFLMLAGQLPLRRGAAVVAGCFLLFGAPVVASGIVDMVQGQTEVKRSIQRNAPGSPPSMPSTPKPYDPYAGASVPTRQ